MKLKALWTIGLSSVLVLSACGTYNDENRKDDKENETSERTDKMSNESKQQTDNNQSEQQTNDNEQNRSEDDESNPNQEFEHKDPNNNAENSDQIAENNEPISIDEAKAIAYKADDVQSLTTDENKLIYNQDRSTDNEIFIETPFGGINSSVKNYAIVNKFTGEIVDSGGAITSPDGFIDDKDGYVNKDIYNTTTDFYNTFVYKEGIPVYEASSEDVPSDQYKDVLDLVNEYSKAQREKENQTVN
ncbi:hypothetical protein [Staphylococcus pettenkoferi]|uniref:hypothetical protein n=2 Tax=Staphylococcus TaxID=1279 RepID=UPI00066C905B|nr:hypothetical protein [Staphylococcus pettenkoferi]MCY1585315.1 hypothetical protein [Staphylococcus pettenkoferi]MCY1616553.1 hypothetical protein [Staphylococcus pettenkoferi]UIK48978.1 hypothetical protein LFM57_05675 [Staphylococcus pettenkoferi]